MGVVGAVTALAASSRPGPFELALHAGHETVTASPTYPFGLRHTGTFTSRAPFCSSGTLLDVQVVGLVSPIRARRQFTCDDGSGTLTFAVEMPALEHEPPFTNTWSIEQGTGRYAGLRGRGTYRGEILSGDPGDFGSIVFRAAWQGVSDTDTAAPSMSVTAAKATKLRRPAGTYSIRLVLVASDDVADNAVSYRVTATGSGFTPVTKLGTTATGTASLTFRVRTSNARARVVQLRHRGKRSGRKRTRPHSVVEASALEGGRRAGWLPERRDVRGSHQVGSTPPSR